MQEKPPVDVRAWAGNIGPFDHLTWVGKDISLADMKRAVAAELAKTEREVTALRWFEKHFVAPRLYGRRKIRMLHTEESREAVIMWDTTGYGTLVEAIENASWNGGKW